MNRKEFLNALEELLELHAGTLKGPEALTDLEAWDSLAVIGVIALVDDNFDMVLEGARLQSAETVDDLIGLVSEKLTA